MSGIASPDTALWFVPCGKRERSLWASCYCRGDPWTKEAEVLLLKRWCENTRHPQPIFTPVPIWMGLLILCDHCTDVVLPPRAVLEALRAVFSPGERDFLSHSWPIWGRLRLCTSGCSLPAMYWELAYVPKLHKNASTSPLWTWSSPVPPRVNLWG